MLTRYLLPLLALLGVSMAVYTVVADNKVKPAAPPVVQPAAAPFASYVAGAGLVEASTENIAIGTHVAGVITQVHVKTGDLVKAGDPLFTIDDRTVRAELAVRQAALDIARAKLARLRAEPRPEDVPPAQARVDANRAVLEDLQSQLAMWERADPRAVADEELSKRRFAVVSAQARLAESSADLARLQAGAWKLDIDVAEAEVASAAAALESVKIELDRHTVTAPVDGRILKLNARLGEFAATGERGGLNGSDPLITLGDTSRLHVRVDVDENDAWRVREGAIGKAYVRGNPALKTDLKFVRFEPYVIPKRSLTGASTERVDTRVLQVIYSFDPRSLPVFVGQQMDVFIDAPTGDAGRAAGKAHADGVEVSRQ
jgi:multidrug resistance efflux pump